MQKIIINNEMKQSNVNAARAGLMDEEKETGETKGEGKDRESSS